MIESGENFSDGCWVTDHTYGSHDFSKITSWYNCWWLIVDTDLESGWAPVYELDGSLGLDCSNWSINILWNDITSVEHWASHIFTVTWITFGHHIGWFESWVGDFSNWKLFMIGFLSWNDWSIWWKHKVNSWIWDQVSLEFGDINI
jgi:hypothetical protein